MDRTQPVSMLPPMGHATAATSPPAVEARDATHELYDRACDLLFAAQELSAAARKSGSAPAIAASTGCLDASLVALSEAVVAMRSEAVRHMTLRAGVASNEGATDALRREFSGLVDALAAAQRAADGTRERVGPTLARLTVT